VHRNCASGMEAITSAAQSLLLGRRELVLAIATESMSNIPLLFGRRATAWFARLAKAKSLGQRLAALAGARPSFLLDPVIGIQLGLTDPVCGMNMGETAELLAREFGITRAQQDAYALDSHRRAAAAQAAGRLDAEVMPLPTPKAPFVKDDCIRAEQSEAALAKLKPVFLKAGGTVTAGNACPITDGAAAVLLMTESKARERGLKPLGYLRDWAYAGLDGRRMGLGPVHATAQLVKQTGLAMTDFDRIEINEAFAAQVLACHAAAASVEYGRKELSLTGALGAFDPARTNVNGGAIAIGHPVGATGMRLVLTLLHELRRNKLRRGLATLCIGGGQGAALAVEVDDA
jgi:acetyl-CoA acetyltransferase family protein